MRKTGFIALVLVLALLLCACQSQEEIAYRAAKAKLEAARNLGGGRLVEDRDAAWQEALDALVALGDYEDAPALADEARDYFYNSARSWFWEIDDREDALDRVRAYLDAIPGYRDTADWATLEAALRLTMDGNVGEGAELARTLPEGFEDNLFRNTILLADTCREEKWAEALDFAQVLEPLIVDDGNGNGWLTRKYCTEAVLRGSGLAVFYDDYHNAIPMDGVIRNILMRYYAQQTDLGNDIATLEDWPCEWAHGSFANSAFGEVDLRDIYSARARRMEESLEQYGVTEEYAKIGSYRKNRVANWTTVNNSPRIDGYRDELEIIDGRVPTPPTEITGSGICFLETSNHYDGVRVDASDLRYRVAPLSLADSVESAQYVCRLYHDYTQTHIVISSDGGDGGLYDINTTVQLIDLVTGETLAACQYHESQSGHDGDRDEVLNGELMPVLRELVTVR